MASRSPRCSLARGKSLCFVFASVLSLLFAYHPPRASRHIPDTPLPLTQFSILVNLFNETRPTPHTVVILDHHSMVTLPDNVATNGIFHGIDEVILPPKMASKYEISQ